MFLTASLLAIGYFMYYSHTLVDDLAEQERGRMQLWADATREIVNMSDTSATDMGFLLKIIEDNRTIPVVLTDADGNVLLHRNFDTAEGEGQPAVDGTRQMAPEKLEAIRRAGNVIAVEIAPDEVQYLYYEDSSLLRSLSRYPYVQLMVMVAFVAVMYCALNATKKAEQNKVWVGLSKETAHQLGTPISSLMAWLQLLEAQGVDPVVTSEMDKDVVRLSTIASRFSKIGSKPDMECGDVAAVASEACGYMTGRISSRIDFDREITAGPLPAMMSRPLLEWVIENLVKNAVDAMEGTGRLTVKADAQSGKAVIEVSDTGRGIARRNFKNVFRPGYTTKQRGWGLGLTLARRIVEEYHGGRIFVKSSEPGVGTTFRVELPLVSGENDKQNSSDE